MWLIAAVGSAIFAGLTSILAKCGLSDTDSDIATALRTIVVLVFAWLMTAIVGSVGSIAAIDAKSLLFLVLPGLTTGASWLCYYYAIQNGMVSIVVPLDKLSILVTIAFSGIIFHEKLSPKAALGLVLMSVATLAMALWL